MSNDENMNDDFDADDIDFDGEDIGSSGKKGSTLGDMWRENTGFKIGVIVVGIALIFGVVTMIGGDDTPVSPSVVPEGSQVSAPPGTTTATPAYIEAIQEETEQRTEEAVLGGGSVLPTPIDTPTGRLSVPDEERNAEDPLQRWRQIQEERRAREAERTREQTVQTSQQQEAVNRSEEISQMADLMSQQMQALLESRQEQAPVMRQRELTSTGWLADLNEQEEAERLAALQQEDVDLPPEILQPAGEIVYAQLLTEANTDVPGPVLAQIVSGPLRGARALGSFSTQFETLSLNFNMVIKDEISYPANAIALDPDTTLPGLATEVDRRYFRRVVLPAAAAFVEGTARAIAESGRTTVTVSGETVIEDEQETTNEQEISAGVEEAGQELREILDEIANDTKVLIRIEAGTPLGLLFLEPVLDTEDNL